MKQFITKCSALALAVCAVSSAVVLTSSASDIDSIYYNSTQTIKKGLETVITYAQAEQLLWFNSLGGVASVSVAYYRNNEISSVHNYIGKISGISERSDRTTYTFTGYYDWIDSGVPVFHIGSSSFTVFADSVQIVDGTKWYFDSQGHNKIVLYCDLPYKIYDSNTDTWRTNTGFLPPVSLPSNFKTTDFEGTVGNSLDYQYNRIYTKTTPTYTTPSEPYPIYINTDASGAPVGGVPELWVYYDAKPIETIEPPTLFLPDFEISTFNVPDNIVTKAGFWWDCTKWFFDSFNLWWLVGLAVAFTLISIIFF